MSEGGRCAWVATVGAKGQIVIPKAARDRFGLKAGDRLIVGSDEVGIALFPAEFFENKMQAFMDMLSEKK